MDHQAEIKKILAVLTEVKKQQEIDKQKVEQLAEQYDLHISIDLSHSFNNKLNKLYPETFLDRGSYYLYNGLDHIARDVYYAIRKKEKNLLNYIKFSSLDILKQRFETSGNTTYQFDRLKEYGINKDNIFLVKAYQNGRHIWTINNPSEYKCFVDLVFWTNEETDRLINVITEEDRASYKEFWKNRKPHHSSYSPIWEIARRENINSYTDFLNYYKIQQYLLGTN